VPHEYGDERIADFLSRKGYHPRSSKHGEASCIAFLGDILYQSHTIRDAAEAGEIVYKQDHTVGSGDSKWNTDLVLGTPADSDDVEIDPELGIAEGEPDEVWLALDAKSVMTEHGKARRNRQRDINSFADIMHSHYPGSVTGGILLINAAEKFKSPLRDEGDITKHDRIDSLAPETVDIFRDIDRAEGKISPNVDGVACIVVEHTNMDNGIPTRLITEPPAPQPGDAVNYQTFLDDIIDTFENRWLIGEKPDISSLVNVDLEAEMNRQIIDIARVAHEIGARIDNEAVDDEILNTFRTQVSELESVIEEIERRHK